MGKQIVGQRRKASSRLKVIFSEELSQLSWEPHVRSPPDRVHRTTGRHHLSQCPRLKLGVRKRKRTFSLRAYVTPFSIPLSGVHDRVKGEG